MCDENTAAKFVERLTVLNRVIASGAEGRE